MVFHHFHELAEVPERLLWDDTEKVENSISILNQAPQRRVHSLWCTSYAQSNTGGALYFAHAILLVNEPAAALENKQGAHAQIHTKPTLKTTISHLLATNSGKGGGMVTSRG